jgi:hypothetical protein
VLTRLGFKVFVKDICLGSMSLRFQTGLHLSSVFKISVSMSLPFLKISLLALVETGLQLSPAYKISNKGLLHPFDHSLPLLLGPALLGLLSTSINCVPLILDSSTVARENDQQQKHTLQIS